MINNVTASQLDWNVDVAQSERGVSFFRNMIVRTLLGVNVLFVCLSFGLLGYFIRPTETLLILHYNVYFGVDIQGLWWQVYILPIAGILFLISHLFFARRFYEKTERIAAYLMLFGSGLLNIAIVIASVSIAYINY